jgi:hypothetical protein
MSQDAVGEIVDLAFETHVAPLRECGTGWCISRSQGLFGADKGDFVDVGERDPHPF